MRRGILALTALLPSLTFAGDGFAGTKGDPLGSTGSGASSGLGFGPMLQMMIAVAVVMFLLKAVLPKVVGKMNKKLITTATSELRIEESANFAGGTLYIVRAKSKSLLLSVASTGVTCLADITEPEAAKASEPTFQEMVDELPGSAPVFAVADEQSTVSRAERSPEEIEAALARLQRLSG